MLNTGQQSGKVDIESIGNHSDQKNILNFSMFLLIVVGLKESVAVFLSYLTIASRFIQHSNECKSGCLTRSYHLNRSDVSPVRCETL